MLKWKIGPFQFDSEPYDRNLDGTPCSFVVSCYLGSSRDELDTFYCDNLEDLILDTKDWAIICLQELETQVTDSKTTLIEAP